MYQEDRQLVTRMLAGDARAFDAFFASYARRLAAFAARRTAFPAASIEDLVQTTLIKAIRNLHRFRGEAALFTWLCEICRNELINLRRKASRRPEHDDIDELAESDDTLLELRAAETTNPLCALEMAAHRGAIAETLNGLPERYARALEWKYGDGFSVDEIARMLGLTTIAAQSLLARARVAFKQSWPEEQPP
ncbi:MAG: RNA polymerase sigma factor [Gammaproteobacteria bacterium]